ncbi:MAG: lamin tail domain-containing protein, partial [Phycisphaerae bacterium]
MPALCPAGELNGVPLVINELLASNSSCNTDPQGQYDDWIELYNYGTDAIDAGGMYLTDNLLVPTKWQIHVGNPAETIIPAGSYLLIWADNDTAEAGLHANFKLSADGEEIGLFDSDGEILIDSIIFPAQTADISFGRYPDANDELRFFSSPSPGRQNDGAYLGQVAEAKFSHNRGFYDTPFSVTIATETKDAVIYYTVDGSEPYKLSGRALGGMVYTEPVLINKTTCLRAKAIKPGWLPTNTDTHTYIFLDDVIRLSHRQATLAGYPDKWWGELPADYGMDPDVYNDPDYRDLMDDALLSIPTVSLVTDKNNLFSHNDDPQYGGIYIYTGHSITGGRGWERPVSAELFTEDGQKEFQANCGLRIQGGESRRPNKCPKHSFSLRFRDEYGPGKLNFELFDDWPVDSFDTIQLRGGFNNTWTHWASDQRARTQYIRDQWMRDCLTEMGHRDAGQGFFVHLYLNGIYWGLYNLHERPIASHYAAYNGGDEESIDAINGDPQRGGRVSDGTVSEWAQLKSVAAGRNWERICEVLDVDNFIDWVLINRLAGNNDLKYDTNWRAAGGGAQQRPWRFYSWDAEHVLEGISEQITELRDLDPTSLLSYLDDIEEFRIRFGDRVHKHLFNNGVLTSQRNIQRWLKRTDELNLAIIAESARWGDYRRDVHSYSSGPYYLYTRNDFWIPEKNRLINNYFPRRTDITINQLRSRGLYPDIDAPQFRINGSYKHGGQITPNARLTMSATGTIWYTLDGTDPRLPGGAVNHSRAKVYSGPITLALSTHVKTRVLSGSTWSALNEAIFAVGPVANDMRITEIMYHPNDPNTEYVELKNIGTEKINLNLVKFTDGIDFNFPNVEVSPGEFVVVVQDRNAFEARYGTAMKIAGEYSGRLNNAGERIRLQDAIGRMILDFDYKDGWRSITDGEGYSLTVIDPTKTDLYSWNEKDSWRASAHLGGSPGTDDSGLVPNPGAVVINEVLAHSHAGASDWIELHNTTDTAIDVGGWFLSDSGSNPTEYQIAAGTRIAPYGYIVFYEDLHFNNPSDPGCYQPFALSENGEELYLSSVKGSLLTGYREVEDFGASETGVSFGRYYKPSTGNFNFVPMSENTPGSANTYPKVGPIVITEIMYNPDWPDGGSYTNDQYEYIELYNISAEPVTLYDYEKAQPWKFTDGIDFTFPEDMPVTIPAGGYLLLVKEPEAFAWRYPA